MKFLGDVKKYWELRPIGVVTNYGFKAPPTAYQIYEVFYADGSTEIVRGNTLHTSAVALDFNAKPGSKESKFWQITNEPRLWHTVIAVNTLLSQLGDLCWEMDHAVMDLFKRKSNAKPANRNNVRRSKLQTQRTPKRRTNTASKGVVLNPSYRSRGRRKERAE